jgi:hypothetical protein
MLQLPLDDLTFADFSVEVSAPRSPSLVQQECEKLLLHLSNDHRKSVFESQEPELLGYFGMVFEPRWLTLKFGGNGNHERKSLIDYRFAYFSMSDSVLLLRTPVGRFHAFHRDQLSQQTDWAQLTCFFDVWTSYQQINQATIDSFRSVRTRIGGFVLSDLPPDSVRVEGSIPRSKLRRLSKSSSLPFGLWKINKIVYPQLIWSIFGLLFCSTAFTLLFVVWNKLGFAWSAAIGFVFIGIWQLSLYNLRRFVTSIKSIAISRLDSSISFAVTPGKVFVEIPGMRTEVAICSFELIEDKGFFGLVENEHISLWFDRTFFDSDDDFRKTLTNFRRDCQ